MNNKLITNNKKINKKEALNIVFRYIVLLIIGLIGIKLLYLIFAPLTIYPVFFVLKLFYSQTILEGAKLTIGNKILNIIPACIAASAYYLLFILNLSTPMSAKTRAKSIVLAIFSFLFLNILRIIIFSALFIAGYSYFDLAHKLFWYFGSTLLVAAIWFANVYLFKIKSIPIYTDFKNFLHLLRTQQ